MDLQTIPNRPRSLYLDTEEPIVDGDGANPAVPPPLPLAKRHPSGRSPRGSTWHV
jgi:hypothetical protein